MSYLGFVCKSEKDSNIYWVDALNLTLESNVKVVCAPIIIAGRSSKKSSKGHQNSSYFFIHGCKKIMHISHTLTTSSLVMIDNPS